MIVRAVVVMTAAPALTAAVAAPAPTGAVVPMGIAAARRGRGVVAGPTHAVAETPDATTGAPLGAIAVARIVTGVATAEQMVATAEPMADGTSATDAGSANAALAAGLAPLATVAAGMTIAVSAAATTMARSVAPRRQAVAAATDPTAVTAGDTVAGMEPRAGARGGHGIDLAMTAVSVAVAPSAGRGAMIAAVTSLVMEDDRAVTIADATVRAVGVAGVEMTVGAMIAVATFRVAMDGAPATIADATARAVGAAGAARTAATIADAMIAVATFRGAMPAGGATTAATRRARRTRMPRTVSGFRIRRCPTTSRPRTCSRRRATSSRP